MTTQEYIAGATTPHRGKPPAGKRRSARVAGIAAAAVALAAIGLARRAPDPRRGTAALGPAAPGSRDLSRAAALVRRREGACGLLGGHAPRTQARAHREPPRRRLRSVSRPRRSPRRPAAEVHYRRDLSAQGRRVRRGDGRRQQEGHGQEEGRWWRHRRLEPAATDQRLPGVPHRQPARRSLRPERPKGPAPRPVRRGHARPVNRAGEVCVPYLPGDAGVGDGRPAFTSVSVYSSSGCGSAHPATRSTASGPVPSIPRRSTGRAARASRALRPRRSRTGAASP
jgi:hypothetical protein